jgi:hypothetical protein
VLTLPLVVKNLNDPPGSSACPTAVLDAMLEVHPSRPTCCVVGEVEIRACHREQRVVGVDAGHEVFYFMELLQAVQVYIEESGRFIALCIRLKLGRNLSGQLGPRGIARRGPDQIVGSIQHKHPVRA